MMPMDETLRILNNREINNNFKRSFLKFLTWLNLAPAIVDSETSIVHSRYASLFRVNQKTFPSQEVKEMHCTAIMVSNCSIIRLLWNFVGSLIGDIDMCTKYLKSHMLPRGRRPSRR